MTSTTSGTRVFNLDVDEIIDIAYDKVGGEHISGVDNKKARRELNLLLIELQNKNVPLNTLDFISVPAVVGTNEYNLSDDVQDIYELNLKRDSIETPLIRYSLQEFHQIPTKTQTGRPSVYSLERNTLTPVLKVWPTPDDATDSFEIMVYRKVEDVTASYQKIGLSYRYLPLVIMGLAYKLSMNRQGIDPVTKSSIYDAYQTLLTDTFEEDRERTDMKIKPRGLGVFNKR